MRRTDTSAIRKPCGFKMLVPFGLLHDTLFSFVASAMETEELSDDEEWRPDREFEEMAEIGV